MQNIKKRVRRWNLAHLSVYLALDLLGMALGVLFVVAAFLNEYMAVFLAGVMLLAIAWAQSQFYGWKAR